MLKFKLDTDSLFFALPSSSLDDVVKQTPEAQELWAKMKDYWFTGPNCKRPGPLKIEETIDEGSLVCLSPKCYIMGTDEKYKRFYFNFLIILYFNHFEGR